MSPQYLTIRTDTVFTETLPNLLNGLSYQHNSFPRPHIIASIPCLNW